jgi:hypothetical protein
MSWSRIPKSVRAGQHWLENLSSENNARRRKWFVDSQEKIGTALAHDKKLSEMFREILELARLFGRADGLREGLDLYKYGLRLEQDKPPAFRAIMKYVVNHSDPENISASEICTHLDRQLLRIEGQKTAEARIAPPEPWGCPTWADAFEKKRSNVDNFVSKAKSEALTERFATLMAWNKWGRGTRSKAPK